MKLINKIKASYWVVLFFGVTAAYFVWLSWSKLTDYFGDSTVVWFITGGIVVLGLILGIFSFKKLAERFT